MKKYKLMTLQINSTEEPVKTYIGKRYDRWADYSKYKCSKVAGMKGHETDVLNEVLLSVLKRDENFLIKLYNRKKVQKGKNLTELDFFVLRAIDLNVNSPTSPYRYKNRMIPVNSDVRLERLKLVDQLLVDEVGDSEDKPAITLKHFRLIRWVYSGLELTELERNVFEYVFFQAEPVAQWPGPETGKQIYTIFNQVSGVVHHVLFFYGLTNLAPKKECTNRQAELANAFVKSHRVKKSKMKNQIQ